VTSGTHIGGDERSAWPFRPVILLAAGYMIVSTVHESAHALTAYVLNIPFTLFHFGGNVARERGTLMDYTTIGVAGPLCALIVGLICCFVYSRNKGSRSALLLLYLATFGVGTFFGNLTSAAFVGDFSNAAVALRLPMPARYTASLIGFLLICVVHFLAGCELRRLSPAGSSRFRAMLVMVVVPVVAGTAIVAVSFLPTPSTLAFGRLAETSFWIFAAVGVLMSRKTASGDERTLHSSWADVTILAVAIIAVRIMAIGISFQR
jgi:hypothetical protein